MGRITTPSNKQGTSKGRRGLIRIVGIGAILMGGAVWSCSYFSPLAAPGSGDKKIDFEVRRGTGSFTVSKELVKQGLLKSPKYFRLYLRLTGKSSKLKAGIYTLNDGMSGSEIATVLTEGKVRMMTIKIPEGWNRRQIGDYLARKGLVKNRAEFIKITEDPAVLRKHKIPGKSTQGYLFPDTYSVPYGFSARRLQDVMIRQFRQKMKNVGAPTNMTPAELHERLILASIVEREAVRPAERPMMAQVFLNRLEKGIPLESCATIQFLFEKPRPRLFYRDLKIPSPYNTYIHKGLPPGPISSPGLAALKASFNPKPGPYLFFVLKPDRSHHFSTTFAEHVAAKKRYLGR